MNKKTHINRPIELTLLCMVGIMLTACKHERYLVVVINNTDQTIEDVTLWYEQMPFKYETIKAKSKETGIFEQHRLTKIIKLTWRDQNGNEFDQVFDTFDVIPKNYDNGRVHLKYQSDNQFSLSFDNTEF